ncbi:MAG TPA: glycosyltransferase family 1 protein [Candidatus Saccharimonadales bacterium]|nr:glycosyltransferase family 1 protein [Candidatus Saccharimonadales bacterium]
MPKKIALDLRSWRSETGGVGRYSRNLLTELLELDQATEFTAIITPADEPEFTLSAPNLRKIVVDARVYSPAEQRVLPKILNAGQFDLVHFSYFNHPLLYRRPFICTIHDMIVHLFPQEVYRKNWLYDLAYKIDFNDCKRAKKIIVPSQSTKNDLVNRLNFDPTNIVITPEGSEAKFRPHSEAEVRAVRQKLNLPEKYLLFVSRWERYKGLPVLLEAYQNVVAKMPELGLVILGKPDKTHPEITKLVGQAQAANPKIITPGFVSDDDLAAIYSAASVYVHPSWYEGFGIMILEAFAAGAPVVTSNTSSLPEVVGDAGLLVDPRNVDELVAAITTMLTDPAQAAAFRKKGFERVKQFSWEKMAEQTLAVYNEALAKGK